MWPQGGRERRFVIECKILHRSLERTISQGLEQTATYLEAGRTWSDHGQRLQ